MINLNNWLKAQSKDTIKTTNIAVNIITALVIPHVALRLGHRTFLNSIHEPLKYPPIANNATVGLLFVLLGLMVLSTDLILGLKFLIATCFYSLI